MAIQNGTDTNSPHDDHCCCYPKARNSLIHLLNPVLYAREQLGNLPGRLPIANHSEYWIRNLSKVASPLLKHAANGTELGYNYMKEHDKLWERILVRDLNTKLVSPHEWLYPCGAHIAIMCPWLGLILMNDYFLHQ